MAAPCPTRRKVSQGLTGFRVKNTSHPRGPLLVASFIAYLLVFGLFCCLSFASCAELSRIAGAQGNAHHPWPVDVLPSHCSHRDPGVLRDVP